MHIGVGGEPRVDLSASFSSAAAAALESLASGGSSYLEGLAETILLDFVVAVGGEVRHLRIAASSTRARSSASRPEISRFKGTRVCW